MSDRAAPAMASARLRFDYGYISREGAAAFAIESPQQLLDWYVQCVATFEATEAAVWHGVIAEETIQPAGQTAYPAGTQELTAYGLEYLLDRSTIMGAQCETVGASIWIKVTPPFNRPHKRGPQVRGNRSGGKQLSGVYEFDMTGVDADPWRHSDIAEYLLKFHSPAGITFTLAGQTAALDEMESVQELEGLTVFQALNRLIDRRRGVGWCVRTTGEGNPEVRVFTLVEESVSAGDLTIPKNDSQGNIDLNAVARFVDPIVRLTHSQRYDKIIVRGERVKACFSVCKEEVSLERAWKADLEAAYLSAASGALGYGAMDDAEKADLNDKHRGTDRFESVFTHFRIPRDWDWTNKYLDEVAPVVKKDGTLDPETGQVIYPADRQLQRFLPMEVGKDYSVSPASDENLDDREPEMRKPFVLALVDGKYVYVDRLSQATDRAVDNGRIRMLDRDGGFEVAFPCRHAAADGHWTGAEPSNEDPQLDWEDYVATVCAETDERLTVEVETDATLKTENVRTLVIDVPEAEAWYVAPDTVVDVSDEGALIRVTGAGIQTRDDSGRLRAVAAFAKCWYCRERAAVRIVMHRIEALPRPGELVRAVHSGWHLQQVNSVVTERTFDCVRSTTTIETGFAEIDFAALGGGTRGVTRDVTGVMNDREFGRLLEGIGRKVADLFTHTAHLPVRGFP
jgi:hypothetical protein